MTTEAEQLLAATLKKVGVRGGFLPADLGAKIGLSKIQSDAAARALANAGVLVLGFDGSAEFSPAYRKTHAPALLPKRLTKKKKMKRLANPVAAG